MTPDEHDNLIVSSFRLEQFLTGSVDPNMTQTLSDGKTRIASAIDFGAPTLKDLFDSQSGPVQLPIYTSGRVDTALKGILAAIPAATGGGTTDLGPVLAAIADLKAHPAVIADPTLAAAVAVLSKHLGVGNA